MWAGGLWMGVGWSVWMRYVSESVQWYVAPSLTNTDGLVECGFAGLRSEGWCVALHVGAGGVLDHILPSFACQRRANRAGFREDLR